MPHGDPQSVIVAGSCQGGKISRPTALEAGDIIMGSIDAGVTLHIDENTTHDDREKLRDTLLGIEGVMAAAFHDEKPHLMVVIYDAARVKSIEFVNAGKKLDLHCELIW